MYAQHFGLRQEPFSIAPDPRYLYMSERHREALAHLLYGLRGSGGVVLLTGEIGAGKTTVCRCFLEQVPKKCNVAYIFNPKLTVPELLRTIAEEFGIPGHADAPAGSVKESVDALNDYLLRTHAVGQNNVLIIDEAQNLSIDVLEQLRLLTNLETAERKLLQIILIGQPELRDILARPELEQLAQRVTARYHLDALNAEESMHYIRHRLAVAGHEGGLPLDSEARRLVFEYSGGVPRRINLLCDRAMLGAYAQGVHRVSGDMVHQAAVEVFGEPPETAFATTQAPTRRPWLLMAAAGGLATLALGWWLLRGPSESTTQVATASKATQPTAVAASGVTSSASATPQTSTSPVASAASATSAASAATSGALTLPLTPYSDEAQAWRHLAQSLSVNLGEGANPCALAAKQKLSCIKRKDGTLSWLKNLRSPIMLVLRDEQRQPSYVIYVGVGDDTGVDVHGSANAKSRLDALTLATFWRGEYAVMQPSSLDGQAATTKTSSISTRSTTSR